MRQRGSRSGPFILVRTSPVLSQPERVSNLIIAGAKTAKMEMGSGKVKGQFDLD